MKCKPGARAAFSPDSAANSYSPLITNDNERAASIAYGGEGAGPSPGFFGGAALISCIAIGLKMTAARAGIQLDKINVDVEMDWGNRGIFGIENVSAGPIEIRVTIAVDSPAPEAAIQAILPTVVNHRVKRDELSRGVRLVH